MQVLYGGKYYQRFVPVKKIIAEKKCKSVIEICFGDTVMAEFCSENSIRWRGIDRNEKFVNRAKKLGYDARCEKISIGMNWEESECYLLIGSLYHFKDQSADLLKDLLHSTPLLIINEPVSNVSSGKGFSAKLGAKLSNVGDGPESFRYTKKSLEEMVAGICKNLPYNYYIADESKKDITIVLERKS